MKTKKAVLKHKFHDLPGLAITDPHVNTFKVVDNNGNWKIERPLFRWVRANKWHADEEAKMLNIGYQIALYDIVAKKPEAMQYLKKLKEEVRRIEKQFKGVDFSK